LAKLEKIRTFRGQFLAFSYTKYQTPIGHKPRNFTLQQTERMSTKQSSPFVHPASMEWQAAEQGVKRRILSYDQQLMMVAVHFEKGARGNMHHHSHRQVSYVAMGRFEVTIAGQKGMLVAGDSFIVEPDLFHGVTALEEGELIDIFSPARLDFLETTQGQQIS
jgi:quercetin dioxygenase-like cupin family protein